MNVFLQLFSTVFMVIPLKISSGWKHTRKVRYAQYLQDQGSVMVSRHAALSSSSGTHSLTESIFLKIHLFKMVLSL